MNIFASDRIGPANVGFPKGWDKLEWKHVKTYADYCKALQGDPRTGHVVLDSSSEAMPALKLAKALTEITCDKKTKLPELIVVGKDEQSKKEVQDHISRSKRWIDIYRGKSQ